jgi:uncharacterized damage-inducible protein DinB
MICEFVESISDDIRSPNLTQIGNYHKQEDLWRVSCTDNRSSLGVHFDPINDALEFLEKLSQALYVKQPKGPFGSSIGAHMRHILDHYQALMLGTQAGYVDYTQRARDSFVEKDVMLSRKSWQQVQQWLSDLPLCELQTTFEVMTEHGRVVSTLGRELSFVSSHAVHHFAFMKQLAHSFGVHLSDDVGVAPATLKNLREQAANR